MEERDQILIERYITGEASSEERAEVNQRMQADSSFRQHVQEYAVAQQALQLHQRDELRNRFRQRDAVLDKKMQEQSTGAGNRNWWIGIAALILGLGFTAWYFLLKPTSTGLPAHSDTGDTTIIRQEMQVQDSAAIQNHDEIIKESPGKVQEKSSTPNEDGNQSKSEELFADYYEPYRDPMMDPAARGDSKPTPLDQFRKAYWEMRYADVPLLFQQLDATYQQNDNYRFQQANALMKIGKVNEAIAMLENIIQLNRSRFVAEAHFYLGLGYLKRGNTTAAKKWLTTYIGLEKAKQKERANEILKLMEKF
jgi:TolA-binding protein